MRRIVVTGLGAVTPLAAGVETSWFVSGRRLGHPKASGRWWETCRRRSAAWSLLGRRSDAGFDPDVSCAEGSAQGRSIHSLRTAAAQEALKRSGHPSPKRITCAQPRSSLRASAGFRHNCAVRTVDLRGVRRLSPFTIPSFPVNLAAGHVWIRQRLQRPTRRTRDGVRGRYRRSAMPSPYPRKRSRYRRVRWNGSMHEHRQSGFAARSLPPASMRRRLKPRALRHIAGRIHGRRSRHLGHRGIGPRAARRDTTRRAGRLRHDGGRPPRHFRTRGR
jgi:hypothetical protein